ncbi:MAG: trehalose-phosphatase [Nocardioidaceae bacterium]
MLGSPRTPAGREGLAAIESNPSGCLAAFDYDGTLAPIVDDPGSARPHPRVVTALAALARHVGGVAVVTGRPAQVAVDLGGFADVDGLEGLIVVGHYGLERWDASTGNFHAAEPPAGLDTVRAALLGMLAELGLPDAAVEDKGLSVAVHVRRLPNPEEAFATIKAPLTELAERNGLTTEVGRMVVEIRPTGMDKGLALRAVVDETGASSVLFAGDDLGDLAAFAEVERLRDSGFSGLLVCSGSTEVAALAERADLIVDGPEGVASFVEDLVDVLVH